MEKNEVREILEGLDLAHAEMVHSWLCFDLINATLPALIGLEKVKAYRRLCDQFFKDGNASVLPDLQEECLRIFEAIDQEVKNGTVTEHFVVEAVDRMKKVAVKPVRTFEASLKQDIRKAWQEVGTGDDIERTFHTLAPILIRIAEQVENGLLEEATGNLLALFHCLANIKSIHETWFEHMFGGGEMTDMEFLTDAAVEVYCHLRQRDDLSEDGTEDMDSQLLLLNQRTGFFGDWTMGNYADMLYPAGNQSQDYSDLENCEVWMDLEEYAQELA